LDSTNSSLGAYFDNRICKLQDNIASCGEQMEMYTMRELTNDEVSSQSTRVDKFYHIAGVSIQLL
jgi:hypothetical protein